MSKRRPKKHDLSELRSLRQILLYGEEKYRELVDEQVRVLETCDDLHLMDEIWKYSQLNEYLSQYRSDRDFIGEVLTSLILRNGLSTGLNVEVMTSPSAREGFRVDALCRQFGEALEAGVDNLDDIDDTV